MNLTFFTMPRSVFGLLFVITNFAVVTAVYGDDQQAKLSAAWSKDIQPLLVEKCGDCHSGPEANAGFDFEASRSFEDVLDADKRWQIIREQIVSGQMPPEDADQLSGEQRELLGSWINETFELVNCADPFPGNVTIRKLNRQEYRNSIRDLLGVDYKPAENFPGDDVGHGFDNIADVLSLPPILMEKYLDAAEAVTQSAIINPRSPPLNLDLAGSNFYGSENFAQTDDEVLLFFSNGLAQKSIRIPAAGTYEFRILVGADQAGAELAKMAVRIGEHPVKLVSVEATRRKPEWKTFRLDFDKPGSRKIKISFTNDYYVPRTIGKQDRNLHLFSVSAKGPLPDYSQRKYLKLRDQTNASARKFVWEFLPRAFRRPVDEETKQRYLRLFNEFRGQEHSFYESIREVTQAVLVSPRFLYRFEEPVAAGKIRSLNNFELATSLSYLIWSSTPDDALLRKAGLGTLVKKDVTKRQVARMLADERSIALVNNFASQWFNLPALEESQPDPELFPGMDKKLLADMATETRKVVEDIFRRDASVLELLESDYSFLNGRLAKHYKIGGVKGSEFKRVSLTSKPRSGVLTHASILTLTSNPNRTSPVKRGKWIMENILGDEPPPPLANVEPLDEQGKLSGSLRERMQQHRSDALCASCHTTMDALGFALENYDAVGRYRLKEEGFDIDARTELPDGTELNGAEGLQKELRTTYRDKFVRCFTEKLLTYALGRGLKYYDRCAVDKIIEQAGQDDYRFSAFVHAVATSDPFLRRGNRVDSESKEN